jgi:hypothetical protein
MVVRLPAFPDVSKHQLASGVHRGHMLPILAQILLLFLTYFPVASSWDSVEFDKHFDLADIVNWPNPARLK